jgi:hypothetical protein
MKTTPTEALEVALYQAPLDLVAIETAGIKCQGEWRIRSYKACIPPEVPLHVKSG